MKELLEKFKSHCGLYPDLQLNVSETAILEAFVEFAERESAQQSLQADGLTVCENCGGWLKGGECENCNSPLAARR